MAKELFEKLVFNGFGPSKVLPDGGNFSEGKIHKNGPGSLRHQVKVLVPKEPGIYGIIDQSGILIYVGKAKNLRKRLQTYFLKKRSKEKRLIRKAFFICWQVCPTEFHALLREIEAINLFLPSANVLGVAHRLRPVYLVLTSNEAPSLKLLKKIPTKYLQVFGPFNGTKTVSKAISILNETLGLRDCSEKTSIFYSNKKTILDLLPKFGCLRYEIGNCLGPCAGGCSTAKYTKKVSELKKFLAGDTQPVFDQLHQNMQIFASNLQFELAEVVKQKIQTLQIFEQILQRAKQLAKLNFLYWQEINENQFIINVIQEGLLVSVEMMQPFDPKKPLKESFIAKIKNKINCRTNVPWDTFQKLLIQRWFKKMKNELENTIKFAE